VRADELRRSGSGANVWGSVEPAANRSRERRVCDRRAAELALRDAGLERSAITAVGAGLAGTANRK